MLEYRGGSRVRDVRSIAAVVVAVLVLSFLGGAARAVGATTAAGWDEQPMPQPESATFLTSVDCTGPGFCVAVGGGSWMRMQQWDGTAWRVSTLPTTSFWADVRDVSCPSAGRCVAVGRTGSPSRPLALRWNGVRWVKMTMPMPAGAAWATLNTVSCGSATACEAIGLWMDDDGRSTTYGAALLGTTWTLREIPPPPGIADFGIERLSCPTADRCHAVGWSRSVVIAYAFDGTAWSPQATPGVPTTLTDSALRDVSCATPDFCMAVGAPFPNPTNRPAVMIWNGVRWWGPALPDTLAGLSFRGVECTSSSTCVVVGRLDTAGSAVAVTWQRGGTWTREALPALPAPAALAAVACRQGACEAVGWARRDGVDVLVAVRRA